MSSLLSRRNGATLSFPLVRREMKTKLAAFLCGGADFLVRASVFFRRSIKDKHRAANLVAGGRNIH